MDVPAINMAVIDKFNQFLLSLRPCLSDVTNHLTNFHSYCEQRSKLYPCDSGLEELSATSIQVCKDHFNVSSLLLVSSLGF